MQSSEHNFVELDKVPQETLEKLSGKKIFFGHKSVGNNIIDGINIVLSEFDRLSIKVIETDDISSYSTGVFAHSKLGENSFPKTKFDSFFNVLQNESNKDLDIAFVKLCFVDIKQDTDINELFEYYKKTIFEIKSKFPNIKIVHCTVPLNALRLTWKTKIKDLLGKDNIWEYDSFINRQIYNEMIVEEYSGTDPIFDIARIESTYPDGRTSSFTRKGKVYYTLIPDYTSDGGHLNDYGKKIVAEKLLLFLTDIL